MKDSILFENVILDANELRKIKNDLPAGSKITKISKAGVLDTYKQYDRRVIVQYLYDNNGEIEERVSNLSIQTGRKYK